MVLKYAVGSVVVGDGTGVGVGLGVGEGVGSGVGDGVAIDGVQATAHVRTMIKILDASIRALKHSVTGQAIG